MGDTGDDYRAWKEHKRERRQKHGVSCPGCVVVEPKRNPTIMMPGQKCRVCETYRDKDGKFHNVPDRFS